MATKTPEDFIKAVNGKKFDVDGVYSVQCVDGFKKFLQWAGIPLWRNSTGNGRAHGYWVYRKSNGFGQYFDFISNPKNFRNGDWVMWGYSNSHPYTHIAMYYNGKEFGQNQHSKTVGTGFCFINGHFGDALGAFRLKSWKNLTSSSGVDAISGAVPTSGESINPAELYVKEAMKHVGNSGHKWVQSMTSVGNGPWCAATCCAVGKACGYNNIIMPASEYSASNFGKAVVEKYGGTYLPAEMMNGNSTPQPGDFVLYTRPNKQGSYNSGTKWAAYHIEIVREVTHGGKTILTVAGNTKANGVYTYTLVTRKRNGSNIGWYARPDWSKVGGTGAGTSYYYYQDLYTTASNRADAAIREVAYLDAAGKPSIKSTSVRLSVVNYTTLLSGVVESFLGDVLIPASGSSNDNIDKMPPVPREIVQYLTGKGLNTAAAVGVVANIEAESNFKTNCVGDNGTSFGICQWHYGRGTAMKKMAGKNWANNLTGQLDYLWYELSYSYKSVLSSLKSVSNTLSGAKQAADVFVRKFEIPAHVDSQSKKRQTNAEKYWKLVVISSDSAGKGSSTTTSKSSMTQGKSIVVPKSVPQTGIVANYTSYTKFYTKWMKGTTQRRLADIWANTGKRYKHQVATIDGLYLIALSPIFGSAGDKVSVILEDNTFFNAIIADEKGPDAKSKYGHYLGNKVDVVEWEAYGESQSALTKGLKQAGWYGKKVDRIINYGKFSQGDLK